MKHTETSAKMKHIVIIGGGFGGITTAKTLLKKLPKDYHITLINKKNYFLFTPMLHEVATGNINRNSIITPIRNIIKNKQFTFIKTTVKNINFNQQKIYTEQGILTYDYLVLALGAKTNYHNTPGAEHYTNNLKDLETAITIRNKTINLIEQIHNNKEKKMITINIIGAGPTGVELAAELQEYTHQLNNDYKQPLPITINLLQKGPTILPQAGKNIQTAISQHLAQKDITIMTNCEVKKITKNIIETNKKNINSDLTIWTSGIQPNTLPTTPQLTDKQGYYHVNAYLQIEGQKNTYALGDCALHTINGKKTPALAQAAQQEAKKASNNILAQINNKPLQPFTFHMKGFLVSAGKGYAAAEITGIYLTGFLAWFIWRTIYLSKLPGFWNKIRVALDWTIALFSKRDTSEL